MKKIQKGFSLIELMIVVAVIGVLTAVAVPQYQNYVQKSELGAAVATLTALKVNVEDKIATGGSFPDHSTDAAMKANLGASASSLGALSAVKHATDAVAGKLILTLSSEQMKVGADNGKIALDRDKDGAWKCVSTINNEAIMPKNCTHNQTF